MHDFSSSREVEARWAPVLDEWLGRRYCFREATRAEQWRGIDRVAIDDSGNEVGIDYKCDEVAGRTGNIFIETVSNSSTGRPGWAVDTQAHWIFYLVAPSKVLAFLVTRLREVLPRWRRRYPTKPARNRRGSRVYSTLGVCVPVKAAERVAEYVADLDRGDEPALRSDAGVTGARRISLDAIRRVIADWWTREAP